MDFFKKKPKKEEKKIEEKAVQAPKPVPPKKPRVGAAAEAYKVLKGPHVTERASDLTAKNQYVFKIWPRANKAAVKKAVEDIFGVDVLGVKIVNVPRKKRRLGRTEGFRKGYKKAIVQVKEGQKIEILPR